MTTPKMYRSRPLVVEAFHYPTKPTLRDTAELIAWVESHGGRIFPLTDTGLIELTMIDGDGLVRPGDVVVRMTDVPDFDVMDADQFDGLHDLIPVPSGRVGIMVPNDPVEVRPVEVIPDRVVAHEPTTEVWKATP